MSINPLKDAGVEVDDRKTYRFAANGEAFLIRETANREAVEVGIEQPSRIGPTSPATAMTRWVTLNAKQWAAVTHLGYVLEVVEPRKPAAAVAIPTAVAARLTPEQEDTLDGLTAGRVL